MAAFLFRRVLQSVLTIFGVLTATFFLVRLAGDPAALLLPIEATDRDIAEFRRTLGLDQPLQIQYLKFCSVLSRVISKYRCASELRPLVS